MAGMLPAAGAAAPVLALSQDIVISQVYGGGGNSGATYTNDFIELFNRGSSSVSVTGWSVQYASSTGTAWAVTALSGTLQPGQYYLVQEAAGAGGTAPLPTPDASGSIAMSATNGKIALVNASTALSGACPTGGSIVDLVGFGSSASCFEGTGPTATLSNTTAALRATSGCSETDENAADFAVGAPNPRNSASPLAPCSPPPPPILVINEIDYDQPSTDAAEFVELKNAGLGPINLDFYTLELVNGTGGGATVYDTIDLPAVTLAAGDYFVICANAATVANCDLDDDPDTNFIQNGAPDAVGLRLTGTLVDAVSYEGNSGAPYTEGSGVGLEDDPSVDNAGISRCADGADTNQNNVDFSFQAITPGAANACAPALVINEIDYDQPGTDTAEFVEIRNNDITGLDLSAFTLVFVNGSGGGAVVYDTIALPAVALAAGDYFVVCANAATVVNCDLDDGPDTNFIQNGAPDAVALLLGTTVIDTVSYEGDTGAPYTEGSGAGLVDDGVSATQGISRCEDGADTNQNNVDLSLRTITPGAANFCLTDIPPTVASTSPADGTPDASIHTNITITFSENVTVTGAWYDVTCTVSGTHTAAVSGGPLSYTLDPDVSFTNGESCTVTVAAAGVADKDDPIDNLAADHTFSFKALDVCTLAYTPIHAIQGSGSAAAITGPVTTQGVVVGDYEGPSPALRGFYLQSADLDADADPLTSEGIFVFNFDNDSVALGDVVRVSGSAGEFQDQTQISSVTAIAGCGTGSVTPTDVTLPFASATTAERFEGMLVRLPQTLSVTEHFQLGRFGQVVLSSGGRLAQPTNVTTPGAAANALQAMNNLNRIIVDDALQNQNPDPIVFGRGGNPLSASNTLRGGDTATGIVGVLTYTWAGNAASGNAFRVRPPNALGGSIDFQPTNPRPAGPAPVGGSLQVAVMNLLNYFNTFDGLPDTVDNCTNGVGGAATDCRGADTQAEFDRQSPKTVAAIIGTGAAIVGVNEIENDGYGPTSALQTLVTQLNAATAPGTWAFVDVDAATGQVNALGTDAIKVGMVYQPALVTPVGRTAALNSVAFVNGGDPDARNRPALAQTFDENATGGRVTVVVNHLKSKGSACSAPDVGDGQGNCNAVRVNAANALAAWLATDPTGSGDADVLIMGDLNSYAREDPVAALEAAGYTNLISSHLGPTAYSFAFDGQWGYLDHALGSATILSQVTGVTEWHINADEPGVLDYNTDFKSAGQIASLYAADQFRVSDHDPVIVGLNLRAFNVNGFLSPIANAPAMNTTKAGSSVPLKFSLGGFQGLDILFGTPQYTTCAAWPFGGSNIATPGKSMLEYDATLDEYTVVWKSSKSWANSCRTVQVTLTDGSYRLANVTFTK